MTANQVQAMDKMYRHQRYIYDITRKYYLFGRDRLIRRMQLSPGDNVLEIGCGTARNLLLLAKRYPQVQFYGLDASQQMLNTAQKKIDAQGKTEQIHLQHCLAEELDAQQTFGLNQPFDAIYFSYTLSMIPTWQQAIEAALANLKTGGEMYIVDFSDQRGLPRWFQALLKRWLSLFSVHYRPELLPYLENLSQQNQGDMQVESLGGHYAFLASFKKK